MNEKTDITAEVADLATLSGPELQERWASLTGLPVPRVKRGLLRMALAWEMQAAAHGGLPRRTLQRLDQNAAGNTTTVEAAPGMRLARAWNGKLYTVTIGEDGAINWDGRSWNSLSEVARAITGTRWSGPAFFGLKQKTRKAA